uniref:Putative secreted protein n=2 Tax=unclassified Mycobacterium TaxID=2642494 RepID=A0A5Q5BRV3_MYCSS
MTGRLKVLWTGAISAAMAMGVLAAPAVGSADATDDYPIPNRIMRTTCTVEQYMAAARDTSPVYYERYMIDYNNRPVDIQNMARDRIYWFFSLDYTARRQYSENTATNVYYEQVATRWGNWAKLFFNNKGVVAHATDVCMTYPPADPSVWHWGHNAR